MKKLQRMANSMRESTILVVECCRKDPAQAFLIFFASFLFVCAVPQPDKDLGEYLNARANHLLTCSGLVALAFKIPSENKSTEKNLGN